MENEREGGGSCLNDYTPANSLVFKVVKKHVVTRVHRIPKKTRDNKWALV